MSDSYAARVRRGVEYLDNTVNDNWHLRIDLDSLNLADGEHCVLGQLWQDRLDPEMHNPDDAYDVAVDQLDLHSGAADATACNLGFNIDLDSHETWASYRWLTLRWKQAIKEKLDAS